MSCMMAYQKSGELLANMHWMVNCKILQEKEYIEGKNMLVDRQHGAIILHLEFKIFVKS